MYVYVCVRTCVSVCVRVCVCVTYLATYPEFRNGGGVAVMQECNTAVMQYLALLFIPVCYELII